MRQPTNCQPICLGPLLGTTRFHRSPVRAMRRRFHGSYLVEGYRWRGRRRSVDDGELTGERYKGKGDRDVLCRRCEKAWWRGVNGSYKGDWGSCGWVEGYLNAHWWMQVMRSSTVAEKIEKDKRGGGQRRRKPWEEEHDQCRWRAHISRTALP